VPESCADLAKCTGTSTDGEYWVYPKATNGKRVKVYCHAMEKEPREYITLNYANIFVRHDGSHWIIRYRSCQTSYKPPLKEVKFTKIAMNIQVW
jgi:hypothetical protein